MVWLLVITVLLSLNICGNFRFWRQTWKYMSVSFPLLLFEFFTSRKLFMSSFITCGVPQRSAVGPLLFFYIIPLCPSKQHPTVDMRSNIPLLYWWYKLRMWISGPMLMSYWFKEGSVQSSLLFCNSCCTEAHISGLENSKKDLDMKDFVSAQIRGGLFEKVLKEWKSSIIIGIFCVEKTRARLWLIPVQLHSMASDWIITMRDDWGMNEAPLRAGG